MNESKHAQKVVERFRDLLDDSTCGQIDPQVFEQLELMIESAIDVSVLDAVSQAKGIAAAATRDISHIVEKI